MSDPSNSAPNSVEIKGSDDLVRQYNTGPNMPLTTGVYQYSTDLFIPNDYTGDSYFILLNTFTSSGDANWSTQVQFEGDDGDDKVISDFDDGVQNDVRYIRGEWNSIRVIMDLDDESADTGQQIYVNDQLVVAKSWVDGVSGGGASSLGAVDLFANTGSPVYYDNIQICELSPLGACCFADDTGSCLDSQSSTECTDAGGVFQGFGSQCGGQCPVLGPDGWELDAPFTWGDAQGRNDSCDVEVAACEDIYEGKDLQFDVTIPWPSNWTFSTAGSELLDTEMLIGTSGICSDDIVDDGGCVPGPGCSGSQDQEGTQAVFTLALEAGNEVYVNLEEFAGECGKFNLAVQAPCPSITLPAGDPEGEPCDGENRTNDGCNMDPGMEAFTSIALDQTILGTSWESGGGTSRDTDWYQIEFSAKDVPNTYEVSVYGEFGGTGVGGWIAYTEGLEGSGDCDDITGFISPFGTFNRCSDYPDEGKLVVANEITVAGTYWIFVGPAFGGVDFACDSDPGANYYIQVSKQGNECTPRPDGDVDNSGETDFDDLLIVLSTWGPCPPSTCGGDCDCDGDVDFDDLLKVLSGWD